MSPIFIPRRPMRIVFFSSGGTGNFSTALRLHNNRPNLLRIVLLVLDRPNTPAQELADEQGIPSAVHCFQSAYEKHSNKSLATVREAVHDRILQDLEELQTNEGPIDLLVLAYRRIITGALLRRFNYRIINQHPADLTVYDAQTRLRRYVGIGGHRLSLLDGNGGSRTSTIFIDEGIDTGPIICQGPFVPFGDQPTPLAIHNHELKQKEISDVPSLTWALVAIATGGLGIERSVDGKSVRLSYDGTPVPYCGIQIDDTSQMQNLQVD